MNPAITIHPLAQIDIPQLVNYWTNSSDEHLLAMGVDLSKRPNPSQLTAVLTQQLTLPIEKRQAYCTVWKLDGQAIGHSNTNPTQYGNHAYIHLHIWTAGNRKKGLGKELLKLSIQHFFEELELQTLYCQPYALNPAPNKTLKKIGFSFVKEYTTTPGSINFEQPVKLWELTKDQYLEIAKK